jgi:ribosome biogenesis ATPase
MAEDSGDEDGDAGMASGSEAPDSTPNTPGPNKKRKYDKVEGEEAMPLMVVKDSNAINKSFTSLYRTTSMTTLTSTQPTSSSAPGSPMRSKLSRSESSDQLNGKPTKSGGGVKGGGGSTKKKKRKGGTPAFDENEAGGNGTGGEQWNPEVLRPLVTYKDVGGIAAILQSIRELIEYPLLHPEIYNHLGVDPPRGILLHGPPGCGKTLLATATAGELQVPLLKISAPEIVSGMSGESEAKIRSLFQDALRQAPCILFIDEIDAITPKRNNTQRSMETRIVSQLLTCMDSLANAEDKTKHVIVIGATNRPDSLDSALRRAGRFDREIAIGIPDEDARAHILMTMCRNMRVDENLNFKIITKKTVGFVGADLAALTREAAVIAVNRIFTQQFGGGGDLLSSIVASQSSEVSPSSPSSTTPPSLTDTSTTPTDTTATTTTTDTTTTTTVTTTATSPAIIAMVTSTAAVDHTSEEDAAKAAELAERAEAGDRLRGRTLTEEELQPLSICMEDFLKAIEMVQPSAKREGNTS